MEGSKSVSFGGVTIIIPHVGRLSMLRDLLVSLSNQSVSINEIIIVSSSSKNPSADSSELEATCHFDPRRAINNASVKQILFAGISVRVAKFSCSLYPGAARNIGILLSRTETLGFIDSRTIPGPSWLETCLEFLDRNGCEVILGRTLYESKSYLGKLIIASSYGFRPLITIPGTLLRRSCLTAVGLFLPNVRAAEDIDLMTRLKAFNISTQVLEPVSVYTVSARTPLPYFKKWFRNYSTCAPYMSLTLQSYAIIVMLTALILFIGFTWNWQVASWNPQSSLYIPNITKLIMLAIFILYALFRGFLLPRNKGAFRKGRCTLAEIPLILLLSFGLDLVKIISIIKRLLEFTTLLNL